MKKTIRLFFTALLITLFSGCHNEVFYNIMNDVPPEKTTVSGVINSIARYKVGSTEFLVLAADGGLRYKKAEDYSHTTWKKYSNLPFELHNYEYYGSGHKGQQIIKVLADQDTLYIISVKYKSDELIGTSAPEKFYIWAKTIELNSDSSWKKDGSWTEITGTRSDGSELLQFYKSNDYYYTRFNVFSTNSPNPSHRRVFIKSKSSSDTEYYELNNGTLNSINMTASDGSDNKDIDGAAYIGNTIYFFDSSAVCSNETKSSNGTIIYFGKEKSSGLFYFDGSSASEQVLSAGEHISCLAVTKDYLLIGRARKEKSTTTSGGVVKCAIEADGKPESSLSSFSNNAQTQLSSSYLIYTLLNVDPSQNEKDSALYSSIGFKGTGTSTSVNFNNIGLWSYYPSRGNWNRE
ncbi:MAG: hypothetical protein IKX23_01295 [Treponema sp.]|nr:hypothetical protein [Treponema sp.]